MVTVKELGLAPNDTIRYTEEDIKEAIAGDQYDCAVSCAIQRRYPAARRIMVNEKTIAFSIDEERFVYPTPEPTIEQVIKPFDRGEVVEPGIVRLTGGIVKPVHHVDKDKQVAEARRRAREIKRRGTAPEPEHKSTSRDYGRFGKGA